MFSAFGVRQSPSVLLIVLRGVDLLQYGAYLGPNASRVAYFHDLNPEGSAELVELRFMRGSQRDRFLTLVDQCVNDRPSNDCIAVRADIDLFRLVDLDNAEERWGRRNVHIEVMREGQITQVR